MANQWAWLDLGNVTQRYGQNGETGIDIGTPFHTPITSLTNGTIVGRQDQYGGGGIVSVQSKIAYPTGSGGYTDEVDSVYYQHLDMIYAQWKPGVTIHIGDVIGLSGGQLTGGNNPSQSKYSNGPHTEVGINAPYGGAWHPLGVNRDPYPWLYSLVAGSNPQPSGIIGNILQAVNNVTVGNAATQANGYAQACAAIDNAMQFEPMSGGFLGIDVGGLFKNIGHGMLRGVFVVGGVALVAGYLIRVSKSTSFLQPSQGDSVGSTDAQSRLPLQQVQTAQTMPIAESAVV